MASEIELPKNIENNNALDWRQVNKFSIDFQSDFFVHVFTHLAPHHLSYAHFHVDTFVVQSFKKRVKSTQFQTNRSFN